MQQPVEGRLPPTHYLACNRQIAAPCSRAQCHDKKHATGRTPPHVSVSDAMTANVHHAAKHVTGRHTRNRQTYLQQADIHGRSSVESDFEPGTLRP
ncbi:hypothetical protein AVEN_220995-1 [Araneus ventricosus]|uniref:Uncharacterized protein n=1 Tax=Araneus ventricosus TaxID=182803 RepID=A0A4Y2EQ01_ARAVE|nr:hypothetical protein AVEN_220995-1 [Araneus ventricosus]